MRNSRLFGLVPAAILLASCGREQEPVADTAATETMSTAVTTADIPHPTKPARSHTERPIATQRQGTFVFKLYGCRRQATSVVCDLTVENALQNDHLFAFDLGRSDYDGTLAWDDRGNEYPSISGGVGKQVEKYCASGCPISALALPDVVIPVWVLFSDFDESATLVKRLRVRFTDDEVRQQPVDFHDIKLTP